MYCLAVNIFPSTLRGLIKVDRHLTKNSRQMMPFCMISLKGLCTVTTSPPDILTNSSRVQIEQCRALVMNAASIMDSSGNREARFMLSAAKIAVPSVI